MKKKTKKEMRQLAKEFLGIHASKEEVEVMASGLDRDVMIDPITGKVHYWADLQDQDNIREFKAKTGY